MKKFTTLAFLAVFTLAFSTIYAGEKPCCATGASNDMKSMCDATFAKLDLNADQKAKMEKLAAECDQGGCTRESMAKMEKSAKGILSKKQFASWKAACSGKMADKKQS